MSDQHVHVRPFPEEKRAPLPPLRRRAEDQIADGAAVATYDYVVDRGWDIPFAEVSQICRVYHAQMRARGGTL